MHAGCRHQASSSAEAPNSKIRLSTQNDAVSCISRQELGPRQQSWQLRHQRLPAGASVRCAQQRRRKGSRKGMPSAQTRYDHSQKCTTAAGSTRRVGSRLRIESSNLSAEGAQELRHPPRIGMGSMTRRGTRLRRRVASAPRPPPPTAASASGGPQSTPAAGRTRRRTLAVRGDFVMVRHQPGCDGFGAVVLGWSHRGVVSWWCSAHRPGARSLQGGAMCAPGFSPARRAGGDAASSARMGPSAGSVSNTWPARGGRQQSKRHSTARHKLQTSCSNTSCQAAVLLSRPATGARKVTAHSRSSKQATKRKAVPNSPSHLPAHGRCHAPPLAYSFPASQPHVPI